MIELDAMDIKILGLAQGDMEPEKAPFEIWSRQLGIPENELLERLARLKQRGIIRDFKAILRHRRSGIGANAMVAWVVPAERQDVVGEILAGFESVTHCYARCGFEPYTIFSMVHAASRGELEKTLAEMSAELKITDYRIFWSVRELKKTSMQYF